MKNKLSLTEATMLALQGKLDLTENKKLSKRKAKKTEDINVSIDDNNNTIVETDEATVIVTDKQDPVISPEESVETDVVEVPVEGDETIIPEQELSPEQIDEIVDEPLEESKKMEENIEIEVSEDGKEVEVEVNEGEVVEVKDETPEDVERPNVETDDETNDETEDTPTELPEEDEAVTDEIFDESYVVQRRCNEGWTDLVEAKTRAEAKAKLKECLAEGNSINRIIKRKKKVENKTALTESKDNHITYDELKNTMRKADKDGKTLEGVIVFTEDSFDKPYSEEERSYKVSNETSKGLQDGKISNSIWGDCLDGKDLAVRLDAYMYDGEDGWKIDYCYLLDNNEEKKTEAVTPDKEYMGVKYFDNKDGYCPVCNSQLYYGAVEHVDADMEYYPWQCEKCGTRGEAWFKELFQGHTVITSDDEDNIDLPFNENKKMEESNGYSSTQYGPKYIASVVSELAENMDSLNGNTKYQDILKDESKLNLVVDSILDDDELWNTVQETVTYYLDAVAAGELTESKKSTFKRNKKVKNEAIEPKYKAKLEAARRNRLNKKLDESKKHHYSKNDIKIFNEKLNK